MEAVFSPGIMYHILFMETLKIVYSIFSGSNFIEVLCGSNFLEGTYVRETLMTLTG